LLLTALTGTILAQDLKIDYQFNTAAGDTNNYFTFTGPIRYMEANKDQLDAVTGASKLNSTTIFHAYKYDVKGKSTIQDSLRGLFLFPMSPFTQAQGDNLTVSKATNGAITIQYVHRGTAYGIITDNTGKILLTSDTIKKRKIGFIKGTDPQVIHTDFSADGTAAKINWKNVWSSKIASGKEIKAGVADKTGDIIDDVPATDAFYMWDGSLQATFEKNILKITGAFNAVKK